MKIAILHLTDIHIAIESDPILDHAESIAASIGPIAITNPDACLVVISGDIANTAADSEYKLAENFVRSIRESLQKRYQSCQIVIVILPGNHDCNFADDQSIRDLVLREVIGSPGSTPVAGLVKQLLAPQRNFIEFTTKLDAISLAFESNPIICRKSVRFDDFNIDLVLLNSAWVSRIKEQIGTHFFPTSLLDAVPHADSFTISVMHHHPSWFNPANRRNLINFVDATSDVLITGHEHESAVYRRSRINEELSVIHVEGGVLQDKGSIKTSHFNVVVIDTSELAVLAQTVRFDGERYVQTHDNPTWQPLNRRSRKVAHNLPFTADWERDLDDLGTRFTHSHKDLRLSDLYIPPNLKQRNFEKKNVDALSNVVSATLLPQFLSTNNFAVIIGEESSGKTALVKYWTTLLKRHGLYPIVIRGEDITSAGDSALASLIKRSLAHQYGVDGEARFMSLASAQRIVLIDDFQRSKLNYSSKEKALQYYERFADRVFLFNDELWELTDWSVSPSLREHISKYITVQIMPFGHQQREMLIRNWLVAGNPEKLSEEDLVRQTNEHKRMIDMLLGKNLLPMYAIFILAYLQQMEVGAPVHNIVGSYGYLYASLINLSLADVQRDSGIDTDKYLSMVAGEMLNTDVYRLSPLVIERLHVEYCKKFHLQISSDNLLKVLVVGGLLDEDGVGISFKYRYIYYYFAARYLSDNFNNPEVHERIDSLVTALHREDNGNIIVFLSYLGRHEHVLDLVTAKANRIYANVRPCDFERDVDFVNALLQQIPAVVLEQKTLIEARDELNRMNDDLEEQTITVRERLESSNNELQEILDFNEALKTVQILGQIIRNSMGSLEKEPKYKATEAVYSLGLRTVNAYMLLLNKHLDQVVDYIESLIDDKIVDKAKRAERARGAVAWLTELFGTGVIKRLAQAVGHEQLKLTFEDVLTGNRNTAYEIIDLAIKLDHYKGFPERELNSLIEKTKKNVLSRVVIRHLAAMRFYLLPTPYDVKQRFCEKLGIEFVQIGKLDKQNREENK